MSDLLNLQLAFPPLVKLLIDKIYADGYACTFGECYRTPQQAALNAAAGIGIAHSEHTQRLAIDLNLFKDGVYQTESSAWKPWGDWWVTKHPAARWGGNFSKPDGNHFSLTYGGVS